MVGAVCLSSNVSTVDGQYDSIHVVLLKGRCSMALDMVNGITSTTTGWFGRLRESFCSAETLLHSFLLYITITLDLGTAVAARARESLELLY